MNEKRATSRADKWLWQARFFKTRSLAAKVVASGHVRINSTPVSKPASPVGPGDVLTFPQGRIIRVIKVVALATRRGPAPEAQELYEDMSPPPPGPPPPRVGPRPTKKARRDLDASRNPEDQD
ncbi:MAG: RNA-binding S4 domain-containing protein [Pseudomonadota bacterium]